MKNVDLGLIIDCAKLRVPIRITYVDNNGEEKKTPILSNVDFDEDNVILWEENNKKTLIPNEKILDIRYCRIGNPESLSYIPWHLLKDDAEYYGSAFGQRNLTENRTIYLAYGSNIDPVQMTARCPHAELIGKARIDGYRFALDDVGYGTILKDSDRHIETLLWSIPKEDEARLDRCEGVAVGLYKKEYLNVEMGDTMYFHVLVYISNRGANHGARKQGYMSRIVKAAVDHAFECEYIKELVEYL